MPNKGEVRVTRGATTLVLVKKTDAGLVMESAWREPDKRRLLAKHESGDLLLEAEDAKYGNEGYGGRYISNNNRWHVEVTVSEPEVEEEEPEEYHCTDCDWAGSEDRVRHIVVDGENQFGCPECGAVVVEGPRRA